MKAYIDQHRQRFTEELVMFCRQPSIASIGTGMDAMADMVANRLADVGAETHLMRVNGSYPYVYAAIGTGARTLLLYNHYDVQPARREDGWTNDPFEPTVRDGRLYARGVADNKANLLFRIQALEAYQAVYGALPLHIRFFVEGEEEIGSPNLTDFVQTYGQLIQADGCIWESGRVGEDRRPLLYLGLRGVLHLELSLQASNREMHSAWANIVQNPALPLTQRLHACLACLTDTEGRPAFVSALASGALLSEQDRQMLEAIPLDLAARQAEYGMTLRAGLDKTEALRRLLFEPSCTVCGLSVGYAGPGVKTVIPNRAWARVDIRLPPGFMPDQVEASLQHYLEHQGFQDIHIQRLVALPPARTSPDAAIVQATRTAIQTMYGVEPVIYPLMPASGPMYTLCQTQNTPVVTFGAGYPGDNVHGIDENIVLDDYFQAMLAFGEILKQFARVERL